MNQLQSKHSRTPATTGRKTPQWWSMGQFREETSGGGSSGNKCLVGVDVAVLGRNFR